MHENLIGMDENESEEAKKHEIETGCGEKENLELSSTIASNDGHNQENVISKLTDM